MHNIHYFSTLFLFTLNIGLFWFLYLKEHLKSTRSSNNLHVQFDLLNLKCSLFTVIQGLVTKTALFVRNSEEKRSLLHKRTCQFVRRLVL